MYVEISRVCCTVNILGKIKTNYSYIFEIKSIYPYNYYHPPEYFKVFNVVESYIRYLLY